MSLAYKVHEMAKAMPRHNAESEATVKESIKAIGIQEPVTIWVDEEKKEWLIDGASRQKFLADLLSEGITKAANGEPLELPTTIFKGTESEALELVEAKNLHRRDLTTSQRAAIAVRNGALLRKYKKAETGVKVDEPDLANGDVADQVAVKYGTNRQYIFDAAKVAKISRELLDEVIKGELGLREALRAANRVAAGQSPFPEPGEEDAPTAKPAVPIVVYDGLKNPVGDDFVHIFSVRTQVKEMVRDLKKLLADAENYADGPGGATADKNSLLSDLRNVVKALQGSQPHCICPYCSGTGKSAEGGKKRCANCKGAQYLDKMQFKLVPDDIKATIPGADGKDEE